MIVPPRGARKRDGDELRLPGWEDDLELDTEDFVVLEITFEGSIRFETGVLTPASKKI